MFGITLRKLSAPLAVGSLAAFTSFSALAQTTYAPVNVEDGVSYLGSIDDSMMAVGLVMFGLAAVAVGIKWVKATFFG